TRLICPGRIPCQDRLHSSGGAAAFFCKVVMTANSYSQFLTGCHVHHCSIFTRPGRPAHRPVHRPGPGRTRHRSPRWRLRPSRRQNRAISPNYKWGQYDVEMWAQTPVNEQQNPALYMKLFAQLAHANGYGVIEVPARDLAQVPGSACPQLPGENLDRWFVRCNMAGAAAAYADIFVLQAQVHTTNLTEFDYLLKP